MMNNNTGGIYIHIPYCKSKCGYCAFNSSAEHSTILKYLDALKQEITQKSNRNLGFDTIYIGGGTPSVLPHGSIEQILSSVRASFDILDGAEITVEANPDSASLDFFLECKKAGVNRVSLGLQTDDDTLLRKLNRPHTYSDFLRAISSAKECGIENLNADLLLGLEGQTIDMLIQTIENVSTLSSLTHISLYALKIEESTPFFEQGKTVDEDLQADMYEHAVRHLMKKNFFRYEVSNFCKSNKKSRHNLKYWQGAPYLGFGLSAHSFFNNFRICNTDKISQYLRGEFSSLSEEILPDELIKEHIMLALRTSDGIDVSMLKNRFNYNILIEKKNQIEYLVSKGIIEVQNQRIKLAFDSYYILNSVILKLI